jgi:hypothetical protein
LTLRISSYLSTHVRDLLGELVKAIEQCLDIAIMCVMDSLVSWNGFGEASVGGFWRSSR